MLRRKFNKEPYTAYPMPKYLEKHMTSTNKSLNFQVIGSRGKGKSTMVRHILELNNKADSPNSNLPKTGSSETTLKPTPYKLTNHIYLWDMPGLGGNATSNSDKIKLNLAKKLNFYHN